MIEFQKEQKGESTFLSCLVDELAVDTDVSGMLNRNHIQGLLPYSSIQIDTNRLCSYNITSKVSLKQFFSRQVRKAVFLDMLLDIVCIVSDAEDFLLRQSDFVFDDEYIFVSVSDGKPNLVCLPVPHQNIGMDMLGFFRQLVFETSFNSDEDRSYVAELNDFLKRPDSSNYQVFKNYLEKMKVQPATGITQAKASQGRRQENPVEHRSIEQQTPVESKQVNETRVTADSKARKERPKPERRGFPLFGGRKNSEKPPKPLSFDVPGISRESDSSVSADVQQPKNSPVKPVEPLTRHQPKADPLPVIDLTSDSTVVMGPNGIVGKTETPWVVHLRTMHEQPVDHSPFRIGKKKEYVDFYVPGNPAVGRSHADIQFRNGTYWLVDNNSLNHTFVNGEPLQPGVAYQLKDRDHFVLANEEFLFELR